MFFCQKLSNLSVDTGRPAISANYLIRATNLPNTCHCSAIGAGLLRLAKGNSFIYKSTNSDRICLICIAMQIILQGFQTDCSALLG